MVQCEECEMWRLLYCKRKLAARERQVLQQALDSVTYNACGAQMQDLELGDPVFMPGRLGSSKNCNSVTYVYPLCSQGRFRGKGWKLSSMC